MASLTQCLDPSRFIKSEIIIDDRSPAAFSFGCIMILTTNTMGGPQDTAGNPTASVVDAADRVRSYTTIDDLANEWDPSSTAYQAALAAFSQRPGPDIVKIGFVSAYTQAELIALNECDSDCYGYTTPDLRDGPAVMDVAAWIETQCKVYVAVSNDPLTRDRTDTTNIAEQLKLAGYDRTMVVYHDDATVYPDTAFLAVALSNDFDQANSAYTGKFQRLTGIPAANVTSTEIQAITGYVPQSGLDANQGHFANTIACHCDNNIFVEGNMSSGRFFDSIHATDFIRKRVQEALCDLLVRTKVPYNAVGYQMQVNAISRVLRTAQLAGVVAQDEFDEGTFLAGYEVEAPNVFNASSAQIANRVGQCVQYTARLTGAFHSVCAQGVATVFSDRLLSDAVI